MDQGVQTIAPPFSPATDRNDGPIRLVAIDLDGTLLNDTKEVSATSLQTLRGLAAHGVKVVIATARPPRSVRHIYRQLQLDTLQINYNGAMIWDESGRRAIFHRPMDGAVALDIIHHARETYSDVQVACEVLDKWYTDRFDPTYITETGKLFPPDVIAPVAEFCAQPITKLMLLSSALVIDQLEPVVGLAYEQHVSVVRTDPQLIQIMDKRVSKAVALQEIARIYDIPMSRVMAIGDAPNDVAMLQVSGIAVAVDNAHPRVKEVADWVAPSNNDHGVHAALRRFGLG